jgi:hypothetical protein
MREGAGHMATKNNLETVASIKKKDDVEIRASLTTWKNDLYIDIREFIVPEEGVEGYTGPTKKGFRFHSENWEDFKKMVDLIDREIQKRLA